MGFIQSNHSRILYNNTMISFNMVEAARQHKVKRFLYTSSACIYPEHKQLETDMQVHYAIKCKQKLRAIGQALTAALAFLQQAPIAAADHPAQAHPPSPPLQAGLRESDAWPAHPQDAYGLEKIVSEECCRWCVPACCVLPLVRAQRSTRGLLVRACSVPRPKRGDVP